MAFSEKQIQLQFSLASGQFEGGGNQATVTGLRTNAQIETVSGPMQSQMSLAIYGMPLSLMNQLSTVGAQWSERYKNGVDVLAGDTDSLSLVFSGIVYNAFVDAADMPNVCLRILAAPGTFEAVKPATPISINGSADAAGLMSQLAGQMGLTFENNGVSVKLASPYYFGSAWSMAQDIADHGNFDMVVERGVLAISPRNGARSGEAIPIGPDTGLVGYPAFVQNSVVIRCLFNPNIRVNGLIDVTSSLAPAQGQWKVIQISHDLDSVTPGGNWFSTLQAIPPGSP